MPTTRVHENDRDNLRRLCAYGARGPLSLERLSRLPDGRVAYRMKRPTASGQTELVLEPVEFLRRLAALVPPPRVNLVRFFFAPNASLRKHLVPKPPKQEPSVPAAPSPAPSSGSCARPSPARAVRLSCPNLPESLDLRRERGRLPSVLFPGLQPTHLANLPSP